MKYRRFFTLLLVWLLALCSPAIIAQETPTKNKFKASLNAELLSNFAWRGLSITQSPTFIPTLMVKNDKLSFGMYGFVDISGYEELDLELSYQLKDFTFILTDYYASPNKYFDFNKTSSQHLLELGINYQIKNYPLQFYAGTMIYGADKNFRYNPHETSLIKQNYSSYIEIKYSFQTKSVDFDLFGGLSPFTGMYGNDFALINLGLMATREIKITKTLNVPLYASFSINPQKERFLAFLGIHI